MLNALDIGKKQLGIASRFVASQTDWHEDYMAMVTMTAPLHLAEMVKHGVCSKYARTVVLLSLTSLATLLIKLGCTHSVTDAFLPLADPGE